MATKELLKKAKECGTCQMTAGDTSVILGVDVESEEGGPLLIEYTRGRLEAELEVRLRVYENATQGDVNAQKMFMKYSETAIEVEPE